MSVALAARPTHAAYTTASGLTPSPAPHYRAALLRLPRQTELPLKYTMPSGVPATPETGVQPTGEQPSSGTSALPNPGRWAGQLVQAMLEVIGGKRPVTQLVRWTSEDVYQHLAHRASRNSANPHVQIRSLHVSLPSPNVAEICATVQQGSRIAAVALRLDSVRGQWQCTDLTLG